MKKIILGIMTLASISAMSYDFEANIKVGYDFFRNSTNVKSERKKIMHKDPDVVDVPYSRGFVIGAEIYPMHFLDRKLKLGAGIEYNFGETTLKYRNLNTQKNYSVTMIPIYATLKYNFYKHNSGLNLYTFGRAGYAVAREVYNNGGKPYYANRFKNTSGIYYGLGFGLDYKYFLAEILYDGKYFPKTKIKQQQDMGRYLASIEIPASSSRQQELKYTSHYFHHKVGIRLGLRLDTNDFNKPQIQNCPKCGERVVEKIVEVEKVVEKFVKVPVKPKEEAPKQTPKQMPKTPIKKKAKKKTNKVRKARKTNVMQVCRYIQIKKK
ncbi:porin family protein [Caviibacter abscessus]|uniref:hypothetical protein n=1 Tax=Caviibacter abscessus TaxID=1766719 RepID=UPI0008341EA7|nr:hypothetical protein [Caviibacter abscessus]